MSRDLPLERVAGNDRRWALALETFMAVKRVDITESPDDLLVGTTRIPSKDRDGRVIRVRYTPPAMGGIPRVSIADLDLHPGKAAQFAGKVVFAGVTAQTASDRWMTPYSASVAMPGIEFHANLYETIVRRMFWWTRTSPESPGLRSRWRWPLVWYSCSAAAGRQIWRRCL